MQTVATDGAPAAIGPYSQAVAMGDLLFCSGQIPLSPATGEVVGGDGELLGELVDQLNGRGSDLPAEIRPPYDCSAVGGSPVPNLEASRSCVARALPAISP